jgi:SM-20-related protein
MLDSDFFEAHGYQVIDNFIPEVHVLSILQHIDFLFEENQMKKAGIGKADSFEVNKDLRGDFIAWLDPQTAQENTQIFLNQLSELITELNRNFYLGIRDFETHFTRYPEGTRYVAHSDKHSKGSARVVSFVFYLNENWQPSDGGALRIFQEDGTFQDIEPRFGRLAFFLSDKIHEVLITNRVRRSITGWLLNESRFI